MKEILTTMARYNREVNRELYNLLDKQDRDILTRPAGSYFHSILGLLNHVLRSDLNWLKAYRDSHLDLPFLDNPILIFDDPGRGNNLFDEFDSLKKMREKLDNFFVDFIDSVSEEMFPRELHLVRKNRDERVFIFGKVLMHVFNHQTHHRGAVAQILDELGIENDYSNLSRVATVEKG